ncbi:hypothetical protein OIU79_026445 [Salix purpurea]|uniref:Uncharacterized protein n=1 Tax=Salix purpurea TaxID=77065 RepID=A0A9Q1A0F0_SALPP|nr:hypothetical protein OIU79_026445 [Salix purpurea]
MEWPLNSHSKQYRQEQRIQRVQIIKSNHQMMATEHTREP